MSRSIFAALLFVTGVLGRAYGPSSLKGRCLYTRHDSAWPSSDKWDALNFTVEGRLIATVPQAHVCHDPTFEEQMCSSLKSEWVQPQPHVDDPAGIQSPFFQNTSCLPYTAADSPCRLGNLVDYAIDVRKPADVAAGIKFATDNNIRLVVKNTGHDFLGRSTGSSALGLWVHNLKDSTFIPDFSSASYHGPAMKLGAGMQAYDAIDASDVHGMRVVTGSCPTVSCAGGYTQGGGHSPLSTAGRGLSADNVLEWEVVLANGSLVTASPTSETPLYWALSGGGGTFGVVMSMTVRAYPEDEYISGANMTILPSQVSPDEFWEAVSLWIASQPKLTEAGAGIGWFVDPNIKFWVQYAAFPNRTSDQVRALMQPFTDGLRQRNISFEMEVDTFGSFKQLYGHYIGLPYGSDAINSIQDSRLIPRDVVQNKLPELVDVLRNITSDRRFALICVSLDATRGGGPDNAVLPQWRDAVIELEVDGPWNYSLPWATNVGMHRALMHEHMPKLRDLAPESGAYVNEANWAHPDWKKDFYGSNYGRLLDVKRAYDPQGRFYANRAVGSDEWAVADSGALCRV